LRIAGCQLVLPKPEVFNKSFQRKGLTQRRKGAKAQSSGAATRRRLITESEPEWPTPMDTDKGKKKTRIAGISLILQKETKATKN
jgi:hypothetical protein